MKTLSSFGGHSFLILAWCGIHNNITVHIEFTQLHKRDNVHINKRDNVPVVTPTKHGVLNIKD